MLGFIAHLYGLFLYQPIYNLVIFLYNLSPEPKLAWAMAILALLVRFLFFPFTLKGFKTDGLLEELTPTVRQIENNNSLTPQEKRDRITTLMRANGINPLTEIYSVIGQLLFLTILYQIVQGGLTEKGLNNLYPFVARPSYPFDTMFLGRNIAHPDVLLSAITAGILFFEQLWEYEAKKDIAEATFSGRWYPLLLPISTFILLVILPATKAVFLAVSILFSLGVRLMVTIAKAGKKATA